MRGARRLLPALGLLLGLCLRDGSGEGLLPPQQVRFKLDFFPHILEWLPGRGAPEGELYEVEYKRYGNDKWTSPPHCRGISSLSCDLTVETLMLSKGYYGRVRAVSGNWTSNWNRSTRFTPQQVTLPPPILSLEVERNTIHVTLQLPFLTWQNGTVRYEDIFHHSRAYRVHIWRTSDNLTFTQKEESTQFDLSNLAWGQQYCITVYPEIKSRPNLGISTEEQCVSVPEEARIWLVVLAALSGVCVFCMLLIFGKMFACLYIRKPVETPDTLKSPFGPRSFWMEQWQAPLWMDDVVVCLDEDSMKRLLMGQKNSTIRLSTDSGFCSDKLSLENEHQSLTSLYDDQEHMLELVGPRGLEDSGTSRDSGICTRETSSSFSQLACTETQGYRRQLTLTPQGGDIRDDSGISMQQNSPCSTRSAGRSESPLGIVDDGRDREGNCVSCPIGGSGGITEVGSRLDLQHVEYHGYLKQTRCLDKSRQHEARCESAEGLLLSPPSGVLQIISKLDFDPERVCPAPGEVQGYLKQASKLRDFSHLNGPLEHTDISVLGVMGEMGQTSFLNKLELRDSGLHHNDADISVTQQRCGNDFRLGQHIFNTDVQMLFPLIPVSNAGFHLDFNSLSLADVEIKDR